MYGKLFKYRKVDAVMADKALAVMNRHGWYLVEELVPFSFFSNKVEMDMKAHMAARMLTFTPPDKFDLGKPEFPEIKPTTKLVDLLGENSFMLFSILKVDCKWLAKNPKEWDDDPDYRKIKEFVRTVKTVNDCAERGVKMITEYAAILTNDEKMRDWLLGVELYRKKYPDFNIKTLNK